MIKFLAGVAVGAGLMGGFGWWMEPRREPPRPLFRDFGPEDRIPAPAVPFPTKPVEK